MGIQPTITTALRYHNTARKAYRVAGEGAFKYRRVLSRYWPVFLRQAKLFGLFLPRRPKIGRRKYLWSFKGTREDCLACRNLNATHPQTLATMVHLYGTQTAGNMFTFNANDGYLEALLRGFRSGILSTADYANLIQCDQLEGLTPNLVKYNHHANYNSSHY